MAQRDEISAYGLTVRPREHVVLAHGRAVDLTSREFEILLTLVERPGWVFSAEQLSSETDDGDYSPDSVSVLVSRLRHKLAEAGKPDLVETVRGIGYRLHSPSPDRNAPASEGAPVSRTLRDALWQLQEAAIEVEHSGNEKQRTTAIEAVEKARRAIYSALAE